MYNIIWSKPSPICPCAASDDIPAEAKRSPCSPGSYCSFDSPSEGGCTLDDEYPPSVKHRAFRAMPYASIACSHSPSSLQPLQDTSESWRCEVSLHSTRDSDFLHWEIEKQKRMRARPASHPKIIQSLHVPICAILNLVNMENSWKVNIANASRTQLDLLQKN